jgi:hypothetical protein
VLALNRRARRNQESFDRAKHWVERLRKEVMGRQNKQLVVAVIANKVDKVEERNKLMRVRGGTTRKRL